MCGLVSRQAATVDLIAQELVACGGVDLVVHVEDERVVIGTFDVGQDAAILDPGEDAGTDENVVDPVTLVLESVLPSVSVNSAQSYVWRQHTELASLGTLRGQASQHTRLSMTESSAQVRTSVDALA